MDAEHLIAWLPRPVAVLARDLSVHCANEAFAAMLRDDHDDTAALTRRLRREPTLPDALEKALARVPLVGRSTECHWTPADEEGTAYTVEVTCAAENVYTVSFTPIAEQVTLEDIQGEARTFLEGVLNHLHVGIVVLDTQFCVTFVNWPQGPLMALFGMAGGAFELIGRPVAGSIPLLSMEQWADVHRRVVDQRETVEFGKLEYRAGPVPRYFQMRVIPLALGTGLGGVCITEDITRVVTLEAELVKNERMALFGQMAIALNHEINNPLLVVIGNAESLLVSGSLDEHTRAALNAIVEAGQRIANVTHRLKKIEQIQLTEYVKNGPMMLDLRE